MARAAQQFAFVFKNKCLSIRFPTAVYFFLPFFRFNFNYVRVHQNCIEVDKKKIEYIKYIHITFMTNILLQTLN